MKMGSRCMILGSKIIPQNSVCIYKNNIVGTVSNAGSVQVLCGNHLEIFLENK